MVPFRSIGLTRIIFLFSDTLADKTAGASSLECLSSIVDRLSSVETSCGQPPLRDSATFSPGSSDSQPCTPESPGSRPVYHVLWTGAWMFCLRLHSRQDIRTSLCKSEAAVARSFYIVHEIVNNVNAHLFYTCYYTQWDIFNYDS